MGLADHQRNVPIPFLSHQTGVSNPRSATSFGDPPYGARIRIVTGVAETGRPALPTW